MLLKHFSWSSLLESQMNRHFHIIELLVMHWEAEKLGLSLAGLYEQRVGVVGDGSEHWPTVPHAALELQHGHLRVVLKINSNY